MTDYLLSIIDIGNRQDSVNICSNPAQKITQAEKKLGFIKQQRKSDLLCKFASRQKCSSIQLPAQKFQSVHYIIYNENYKGVKISISATQSALMDKTMKKTIKIYFYCLGIGFLKIEFKKH